ncbi:hypothetical protein [Pirellulimonas nuda]|nr:hypothetical protein [Pirellulimonas nuda]
MIEHPGIVPGQTHFVHRIEAAVEDFQLWARGSDARLGPLRVLAVSRPVLTSLDAEIVYPSYLQRPTESIVADAVQQVPAGSRVTLLGVCSKALTRVSIEPAIGTVAVDDQRLRVVLPTTDEPCRIAMTLIDQEGVASDPPFGFSLSPIPDTRPSITLETLDVAGVVTPRAVLALAIDAADDHGLTRVTLAADVNGGRKVQRPVSRANRKTSFRGAPRLELSRNRMTGRGDLGELKPGDRIRLSATAFDACDLDSLPHSTTSRVLELEVVSEQQLLARIAEREANLRRVFEQTYAAARRERLRISELASEPWGDDAEAASVSSGRVAEAWRRLADETQGAAASADAIVREVSANQVEDAALVRRIRDDVAGPLTRIGKELMPTLVAKITSRAAPAQCDSDAGVVLEEMKRVIDQMQTIDEYNALVLSLRGLIDGQRSLEKRTEKAGKSSARSLLLD